MTFLRDDNPVTTRGRRTRRVAGDPGFRSGFVLLEILRFGSILDDLFGNQSVRCI